MTEPQQLRKRFHQHIADIDAQVNRLFAMVTEGVAAATESLMSGDRDAARAVASGDQFVDQLERQIEQLAERELLMESPMAGDMRYLVSVLRVVPELERSGDLAEHVALRSAGGLAARLTPAVRGILEQMGTTCVEMWKVASDAWAERDGTAAERLDQTDDHLDSLAEQLVDELLRCEVTLADALSTTLIGRFFERLGDHAVHISERIRHLAGA